MSSVPASAPTLSSGQHVIVRNVHVGMLPATVEKVDGAKVSLALAVKDERVERLVGHEMAIEVTTGRGIHRYTGTLSAQKAGLLTIVLSGDIERIQRREFVRVAAHLEVAIEGVDDDAGGETTTLDLSCRGMRIADKFDLPLGIDVRIVLQLPDPPPLTALGRVVRVGSDDDQKGIRFDSISRADEDRLMRYIRDREVKALRASRG
jgi:c-di-GMP-binding flagellar brake protein YcgR